MSKEINYDEKYEILQDNEIPEMREIIKDFNSLIELRFGRKLSEDKLPNIAIQYNNSSINIDWDFRHAGIDPLDNLVRDAIDSDMIDIVERGKNYLIMSAMLIGDKRANEEIVVRFLNSYNNSDKQLWKYNYKENLINTIIKYLRKTYINSKSVQEQFDDDMLKEILDTLEKLGLSELKKEMVNEWNAFIEMIKCELQDVDDDLDK